MSPPRDKAPDLQSLKAEWVARVVRDPARPPGTFTIVGFLADSAKDAHVRVYADHELSSYVDIPVDAVLHAQRLPAEQSPLGEVIVWVRRDATILQGAESAQAAGSWFEGPIVTDQYAAAAAAAGAGAQAYGGFGGPGLPGGGASFPPCGPIQTIPPQCQLPTAPTLCCPTLRPPFCPPLSQWCPRTPVRPCLTQAPICKTVIACPPKSFLVPCHTVLAACFKTPIIACQTQNVLCNTAICPRTPLCPQTPFCPVTPRCPIDTFACPNSAGFACTGVCPSVVDGCPSAPGGCDWTTVVNPTETIVNPGFGAFNPTTNVINPGGWTGGTFG